MILILIFAEALALYGLIGKSYLLMWLVNLCVRQHLCVHLLLLLQLALFWRPRLASQLRHPRCNEQKPQG